MTQFLVFGFVIWSISEPWKMSQLFLKPKGLKNARQHFQAKYQLHATNEHGGHSNLLIQC